DAHHVGLDQIERLADLHDGGGVGDVLRGRAPVAPFAEPFIAERHDLLHHAQDGIADALGGVLQLGEVDVLDFALGVDLARGLLRTTGITMTTRIAAVAMTKARLIGWRTNTVASPPDISIERRRFSSIIGPSTKPSSMGASGKPSRMQMKPTIPNAAVR